MSNEFQISEIATSTYSTVRDCVIFAQDKEKMSELRCVRGAVAEAITEQSNRHLESVFIG